MRNEQRSGEAEADLRRRLREAEETLAAIHLGEVDAVVVEGPNGQQVYCLESPDQPFRIFVERMQEGALTVSADGTIIYCNPVFARLVGRPTEQVRGQRLSTFIAPAHRTAVDEMLETAAAEVVHGEGVLLREQRDEVPVQLALNRLPAEHVRMFGIVVTDLTERQRAERLELQRQAAEDAKIARDQFLAVMSHELRAPLSAILGWAQVLQRREDLPELAQQGLEVILRNAWAQSHLIEDLLDVSRILAGKLRLELRPTNLMDVVRAAVASAEPDAGIRHITIAARGPGEPLEVWGDANRLQQIVSNLLSNAVKFSPDNGAVRVELRKHDGFAEITVADDGIGIAADNVPRMFELYQQLDITGRDTGGLGLGLAIVKQLAELHGGDVSASSPGEGQGAVFKVRLPLATDSARPVDDAKAAAPADVTALRGLRLLVVEDQRDERDVLVHLFSGAGAEVLCAGSADAALQLLEREPVDLLISDIALPDTNGYELIRRIRAAGFSGRDLPAIAVTAFASRSDRRQALVAGYQMHVAKPLDQDELLAVVANLAGTTDGGDTSKP